MITSEKRQLATIESSRVIFFYKNMKEFEKFNPIVIFIYFMSVILIPMFVNNIFLSLVSLILCLVYYYVLEIRIEKTMIWLSIFLFLTISILNVLWNHRGETILFFWNDSPITFETLFFGISFALVVVNSVFWFRLFSCFFTSDKLLYIFSKVSPNVALILTISIRFVDMYIKKFESIDNSIKGVGYYKDYSVIDNIKCKSMVFNALVTWALENGIITADSMVARGFGVGKRTSYYIYKWSKEDKMFLVMILVLEIFCILFAFKGSFTFNFYPTIEIKTNFIYYFVFYLLVFLGIINQIIWRYKWHNMLSKI